MRWPSGSRLVMVSECGRIRAALIHLSRCGRRYHIGWFIIRIYGEKHRKLDNNEKKPFSYIVFVSTRFEFMISRANVTKKTKRKTIKILSLSRSVSRLYVRKSLKRNTPYTACRRHARAPTTTSIIPRYIGNTLLWCLTSEYDIRTYRRPRRTRHSHKRGIYHERDSRILRYNKKICKGIYYKNPLGTYM